MVNSQQQKHKQTTYQSFVTSSFCFCLMLRDAYFLAAAYSTQRCGIFSFFKFLLAANRHKSTTIGKATCMMMCKPNLNSRTVYLLLTLSTKTVNTTFFTPIIPVRCICLHNGVCLVESKALQFTSNTLQLRYDTTSTTFTTTTFT